MTKFDTTDKLTEETGITTVRSSTVEDLELGGHKSVIFIVFVEPKQHKIKIVLDYLDPPVHDESVLLNENMSPADFVLPRSTHDYHLLSQEERDTCIDSVAYKVHLSSPLFLS